MFNASDTDKIETYGSTLGLNNVLHSSLCILLKPMEHMSIVRLTVRKRYSLKAKYRASSNVVPFFFFFSISAARSKAALNSTVLIKSGFVYT
jgi:hypothetical protein